MHLSLERRMLIAAGLVIVLILSIFGTALLVAARQRKLSRRVEHSYLVQREIQRVLALLTRAEAIESGLLSTNAAPSPPTLDEAMPDVEPAIATLEQFTDDNAGQRASLARLRARLFEHVRAPNGNVGALNHFKNEMADVERAMGEVTREEDRLLKLRSEAAESYRQTTSALLMALRLIVVLLLGSLCLILRTLHIKTITTLESITDCVFALDRRWHATYVNGQAETLLGKRRTELLGRNIRQIFPGTADTILAPHFERASRERTTVRFEEFFAPLNRWIEVTVYPSGGALSLYLRDTTERVTAELQKKQAEEAMLQAQERLEEANRLLTALAITDGLTGINNHRAFQERLAAEFERTQRHKTPTSLILLDVDRFKAYNDTFGHPEGDTVLKTMAQVLLEAARETDVVCRYGGEEFVIILPSTDKEGAIEAAELLRAAVEAHPWARGRVTASFGIATLQADLTSAHDLLAQADHALYASKENGRNRATHFADITLLEGLDELAELGGNRSQPYSDIVREMLQMQKDALSSASEQVREMLTGAYDATIVNWSRMLTIQDKETEAHIQRVTRMMTDLARSIGMNEEEVLYARWGALLHDIGKMGVPTAILHKPGPLTAEEWEVMSHHTATSCELLSPVTFLRPALDIPYCHHEKWDGTGYPRGLQGDAIPIAARLFAVIDVYDALTNSRPDRRAWSRQKAITHLCALSGTHFDPRAVTAFLAMLYAQQPEALPAPDAVLEVAA